MTMKNNIIKFPKRKVSRVERIIVEFRYEADREGVNALVAALRQKFDVEISLKRGPKNPGPMPWHTPYNGIQKWFSDGTWDFHHVDFSGGTFRFTDDKDDEDYRDPWSQWAPLDDYDDMVEV